MNRKLKKEELTHEMFVQCQENYKNYNPSLTSMSPTIYQIIIRDGQHYYKVAGSKWVIPGNFATDIWWETDKTKSLNRETRLKKLGI